MKAKEYTLLARCVEEGIAGGYAKAHKHEDDPTAENIRAKIYDYVMLEICEYFKFEDDFKDET